MSENAITEFQGEHRWLSNFWPTIVIYEGGFYPSAEHAYQAAKTLIPAARELIKSCSTPGRAKRVGKQILTRPNWERIKLSIMEEIVRAKFSKTELREKLKATHPAALIEGNLWNDTFWGVYRGHGYNHLGKILMKIRDEIKT